jgi:CspA family cold shock protein
MASGTVKFFLHENGYGFIKAPDQISDVFFHVKDVADGVEVQAGDHVEFGVAQDKRDPSRLKAVNVKLVM